MLSVKFEVVREGEVTISKGWDEAVGSKNEEGAAVRSNKENRII